MSAYRTRAGWIQDYLCGEITVNDVTYYAERATNIDRELQPRLYDSIVLYKQIRHILPDLYKGKIILDAGCGDGRLVNYFANHGARLAIGTDISYDYIKSGQKQEKVFVYNKRIETNKNTKVFFINSNAEMFPLKDNSIDIILAFAMLHHIAEKSSFISECRRLLVDRGSLIIVDPNGGHILRNLINHYGKKIGFLTETENAIDMGQVERILSHFNFSIQDMRSESLFGDINAHLAFIIFKRNRLIGKMVQLLTPLCFIVDSFLDATLFKIFPNLGWRFFILSKKEPA